VPDEGVDDGVEKRTLLGVGEDDRCQRRPVQDAVRAQYPVTECLDDGGQSRRTGCQHLTGDQVGVDDHGPARGEQRRHGALARSDSAGQPDAQHTRTVAIQPGKVTER
jgi:hypothetical protein